MDYTFEGRITWSIMPQSMATDAKGEAIERKILDAIPDLTDDQKGFVTEFSVILACTEGITTRWKGGENPALKQFVSCFETYQQSGMETAELWAWRLNMPFKIRNAWIEAFKQGQELYEVDPVQLPSSMLTDEQQVDPVLKKTE